MGKTQCHGCGKKIRGGTHCPRCVRSAGGYQSNMAAELADAERRRAARNIAQERDAVAKAERLKKIADRAAALKAAKQKKELDEAKRIAALKAARKISNARNRPEPKQPKKKGWW